MDITALIPRTLVIAFGHKSGQGKDTSAQAIIAKHGAQTDIRRYAFGDSVKTELYDVLQSPKHPFWQQYGIPYHSLPHPRATFVTDTEKLSWIERFKPSFGPLMQVYGTDYRRQRDPFYWINVLRRKIEVESPTIALVTDMRFYNEALFVKACKGVTVRVVRANFVNPERPATHLSETELDGFQYDYEIHANGLEELQSDALDVFNLIYAAQQPLIPEFTQDEAFIVRGN